MKPTDTSTSGQEKSLTPDQANLVRYLVYLHYSLGSSFIGMKVKTLGLDKVDKYTTVDEYFAYADKYFKDFLEALEAKNEKQLKDLLDTLENETKESFKDFSTITDDEKAEILAQRIMCRSMIDKIRELLKPENFDLAKQTLQKLETDGEMVACMNLEAEHNIIIMNYYEHGKLRSKLSSDIKEEINQILQSPQALIEGQEGGIKNQVFEKYEKGLPTPASTEAIIDPEELAEASLGEQKMIRHNLGSALYDLEEAAAELNDVLAEQKKLDEKSISDLDQSDFDQHENLYQQAINCKGKIIDAAHTINKVNEVVTSRDLKSSKLIADLQELASDAAALEEASEDPKRANDLSMLANKVGLGKQPD